MMNHGPVIGSSVFHLTIVDHVFVTAAVVCALELVSPVGLLVRSFALVIGAAGTDARHAAGTRFLFGVALEALLPAEVASVLEHVAGLRVESPEGALAGLVGRARHFDEAVVEGERMPDRVLPALLVLPVEREQVHDELVDLAQRQHLGR